MAISSKRASELAELFESLSKAPANIIDPPFDCVTANLKPETYAELAEFLRAYAKQE